MKHSWQDAEIKTWHMNTIIITWGSKCLVCVVQDVNVLTFAQDKPIDSTPSIPEFDESAYYASKSIITLGQFREGFLKGDYGYCNFGSNFGTTAYVLREKFKQWAKQRLFLVFDSSESEDRYLSLAPKRGNRKFLGKVLRRVIPVKTALKELDPRYYVHHGWTRALFITLTIDPSRVLYDRSRAMQLLMPHFDNFYRAFTKKYGAAFCMKGVIEITQEGYPHLHLIMVFKSRNFKTFLWKGKYRIKEKRDLEHYWKLGFMDVEGIKNPKMAGNYVVKYAVKMINEGDLTTAMNWYFRKHTVTFRNINLLDDLIKSVSFSHQDNITNASKDEPPQLIFRGLVVIDNIEGTDRPPPAFFHVEKYGKLWEEIEVMLNNGSDLC